MCVVFGAHYPVRVLDSISKPNIKRVRFGNKFPSLYRPPSQPSPSRGRSILCLILLFIPSPNRGGLGWGTFLSPLSLSASQPSQSRGRCAFMVDFVIYPLPCSGRVRVGNIFYHLYQYSSSQPSPSRGRRILYGL